MNINDKIELVKKIKTINKKDSYKEIFLLILKNDIKYTTNSNGIFFNIKDINLDLLNEINEITNN